MKTRRFWMLLMALLACGLIAAGCGDDEDENASDEPAATEAAPAETTEEAPAEEESAEEDAPKVDEDDPAVQQAVDACKQSIEGNTQLSDDVKTDLNEICEKAAKGDPEEVKEATRDVCIKIVEETVPEGPAREQATQSCEQATQ